MTLTNGFGSLSNNDINNFVRLPFFIRPVWAESGTLTSSLLLEIGLGDSLNTENCYVPKNSF